MIEHNVPTPVLCQLPISCAQLLRCHNMSFRRTRRYSCRDSRLQISVNQQCALRCQRTCFGIDMGYVVRLMLPRRACIALTVVNPRWANRLSAMRAALPQGHVITVVKSFVPGVWRAIMGANDVGGGATATYALCILL